MALSWYNFAEHRKVEVVSVSAQGKVASANHPYINLCTLPDASDANLCKPSGDPLSGDSGSPEGHSNRKREGKKSS